MEDKAEEMMIKRMGEDNKRYATDVVAQTELTKKEMEESTKMALKQYEVDSKVKEEPKEESKEKTVTFTRDADGRISGATITDKGET